MQCVSPSLSRGNRSTNCDEDANMLKVSLFTSHISEVIKILLLHRSMAVTSAHGLVEHDGHTLSFLNLLWSCDRPGHCIALKPCYSCRWRTVLWLGSLRSSDLGCQIKRVPILEYLGMTNKPTKNRLPGTPRTIKMEGELCLGAFHLPSGRWNPTYLHLLKPFLLRDRSPVVERCFIPWPAASKTSLWSSSLVSQVSQVARMGISTPEFLNI